MGIALTKSMVIYSGHNRCSLMGIIASAGPQRAGGWCEPVSHRDESTPESPGRPGRVRPVNAERKWAAAFDSANVRVAPREVSPVPDQWLGTGVSFFSGLHRTEALSTAQSNRVAPRSTAPSLAVSCTTSVASSLPETELFALPGHWRPKKEADLSCLRRSPCS
jgi:hypothetical protein